MNNKLMKIILITLAIAVLSAVSAHAGVSGSIPDVANVVVTITSNRWTSDKDLIVTGTLTNTSAVAVTVTKIVATGFDKNQHVVADGPEATYTIGDTEIAAGATVIFKAALSDAKRVIRYVKAVPIVAPIPSSTSTTPDEGTAATISAQAGDTSLRSILPPNSAYFTYPRGVVEMTSGPLPTEIDVISNGETDGYLWEVFTIHGKPDQLYTTDIDEVALKEKIDKVLAEKASWWGGLFR